MRYESVTEGALGGEPAEVEGRLSGVLDTATGAGTGELHLPGLGDLAAEADAAGEAAAGADLGALARLSLSWTATEVTAVVGGERHTAARDEQDNGVVGRVPSEPAGLFDAVAAATDVTVEGREVLGGVSTTHLSGSVEPQAAVDAGLGTQARAEHRPPARPARRRVGRRAGPPGPHPLRGGRAVAAAGPDAHDDDDVRLPRLGRAGRRHALIGYGSR